MLYLVALSIGVVTYALGRHHGAERGYDMSAKERERYFNWGYRKGHSEAQETLYQAFDAMECDCCVTVGEDVELAYFGDRYTGLN